MELSEQNAQVSGKGPGFVPSLDSQVKEEMAACRGLDRQRKEEKL